MDLFNRPPSIAEDTLQYELYPIATSSAKADVTALAIFIQQHVQNILGPQHIWHRDAFELKITRSPTTEHHENEREDYGWMLQGRMRVGDCVDDEWCMVWLLKEISQQWDVAIRYETHWLNMHHQLNDLSMVSVYDSDGEFLLIEAAEALPSWVSPTNAENRVRQSPSTIGCAPKGSIGLDPRLRVAPYPHLTHLSTV